MTGDQLVGPVVISAGDRRPKRPGILRWDVDGGGEDQLEVDALARVISHAIFHVVTALLPAHDFIAALIGFRIVENLVGDGFLKFALAAGSSIGERSCSNLE